MGTHHSAGRSAVQPERWGEISRFVLWTDEPKRAGCVGLIPRTSSPIRELTRGKTSSAQRHHFEREKHTHRKRVSPEGMDDARRTDGPAVAYSSVTLEQADKNRGRGALEKNHKRVGSRYSCCVIRACLQDTENRERRRGKSRKAVTHSGPVQVRAGAYHVGRAWGGGGASCRARLAGGGKLRFRWF